MTSRDPLQQEKWNSIINKLAHQFADGDLLNLEAIIYLIGLRELGQGQRKYSKEDKIALMHIAICRLLEPYGYYSFEYVDNEGWPHYKLEKALPQLKPGEQTVLIKEAIISYFEDNAPEFLVN